MAVRPPRVSSRLAVSESAKDANNDPSVPMLNIIPATPQDTSEEFTGAWASPPRRKTEDEADVDVDAGLEGAINMEKMNEVPLDPPMMPAAAMDMAKSLPSIDVDFDFSPFAPLVDLPLGDLALSESTTSIPPETDLPPSPPFESFSSLPSLWSHTSMPSSDSEASMPSSASTSSLNSFPDVEEALGSMLASLSDTNLPDLPAMSELGSTPKGPIAMGEMTGNPGLGLGLDLPDSATMLQTNTTAPLSPARRRRAPAPAPLDLSMAKMGQSNDEGISSAPPRINHRVAFYRTAKAAPNSPSSGVFTLDLAGHSPLSSLDLDSWLNQGKQGATSDARDSISLKSEASDDDLHTASIISLTPVLGDRARMVEMREEVMLPMDGLVGVAL
jgi:hypothetical protein